LESLGTSIGEILFGETKMPPYSSSASALNALFSPAMGGVMIRWYPDWQTAVAWLLVTALASVIYFVLMTRVIGFGGYVPLGGKRPEMTADSRASPPAQRGAIKGKYLSC
jgi:hypothetical protein